MRDLATADPPAIKLTAEGQPEPFLVTEVREFTGRNGAFRRRWLDIVIGHSQARGVQIPGGGGGGDFDPLDFDPGDFDT